MLDTHAWLWLVGDPSRLTARARRLIESHERVGVAAISAWELGMLLTCERVRLDRPAASWLRQALARPRVQELPLAAAIALAAAELPDAFPRDPADRLIYATARARRAQLVTKDERLREHDRRHGLVAGVAAGVTSPIMAPGEEERGAQPPSEQRGGTTPNEAEAREKGEWAATSDKGVVPAELGGSDAPEELLDEDPELVSDVLGETTGSDEPATEEGIDPAAGDEADATAHGGPEIPDDAEPDTKDIGLA